MALLKDIWNTSSMPQSLPQSDSSERHTHRPVWRNTSAIGLVGYPLFAMFDLMSRDYHHNFGASSAAPSSVLVMAISLVTTWAVRRPISREITGVESIRSQDRLLGTARYCTAPEFSCTCTTRSLGFSLFAKRLTFVAVSYSVERNEFGLFIWYVTFREAEVSREGRLSGHTPVCRSCIVQLLAYSVSYDVAHTL
ncbi:uncharacterized protein BDZ99DRAFT_112871 [Mytilinidion resinicola]|uniref:Uncharacterized protein n=1 Tax=Mytilinidion resinicola TaxID=574789 RepID=A0A6A6Y8Y0_9PEZI|nr:uncharacterized protein BDZ99DRAFT_112871 [Mytilinidion resinicola]KAF2805089.1 hypothetical protein BDZ99DRAFT_112871 [Mytilinidion resinicola]